MSTSCDGPTSQVLPLMELNSGSSMQIQVAPVYFDREDVKRVIHAPLDVSWTECVNSSTLWANPVVEDTSMPSSYTVLPSVIENSERSVIVNGLADFVAIAEAYVAYTRQRQRH